MQLKKNRKRFRSILIILLVCCVAGAVRANPRLFTQQALDAWFGAGVTDRTLALISLHPENGPVLVSDPVETLFGGYSETTVDLHLGGPLPLWFGRSFGVFNGSAAASIGIYGAADSPMGANWVHNFFILLRRIDANNVLIYYYQGHELYFRKSEGTWTLAQRPPSTAYQGTRYQLVESGTTLRLLDPLTQHIHVFDISGLATGALRGLAALQDRNGNSQTLTYNADGTLKSVSDNLGRSLTFSYITSGGKPRVSQVTDHSGRSVRFEYSTSRQTRFTDPNGKVTTYAYDARNLITSITRPRGNLTLQNTYAASGAVTTQRDGLGNITRLSFEGGDTVITDPLGNTARHRYNSQFRLVSVTDQAGKVSRFEYDASHRRTGTIDRLGDRSTVAYDATSGKVTSRTDNSGNTWRYSYAAQDQDGFTFYDLTRIEYPDGTFDEFVYDPRGNLSSHRDRADGIWNYTYNNRGQLLTATNPSGGLFTLTYNSDGTLATVQDPAGNTTGYTYDALKRLERITRADDTTVLFTYDANDNLISRTNEKGKTTTFAYDDNNNVRTLTNALGKIWTLAYDANDKLTSITDPPGKTQTFSYDALQRVKSVTDRNGNTIAYGYDARGRLTSIVDPAGKTRTMVYDDEGVLTELTNPLGQKWQMTSDRQGRITSTTSPLSHQTQFEYDALSRLISWTNPLGEKVSYAYDPRGLLRQVTEPESVSAGYERDSLGRITQVSSALGQVGTYAYDNFGRLATSADPLGNTTQFQYDARNRASHVDLPLSNFERIFDPAGLLTALRYSDGTELTYQYDDAHRLTSANGVSLTYDDANRLTASNGIGVTRDAAGRIVTLTLEPGKTITYAYDPRNLLTSVTDWLGGITGFTYDDAGRLVSISRPNGVATNYQYDSAGRLTGMTEVKGETTYSSFSLTRDGAGQITEANRDVPTPPAPIQGQRTYTYNVADQITQFKYDAMGRLIDDGARTYTWDLASRLRSYREGTATVEFTYDGFGNCLTRSEGGKTRSYLWNYAYALPSVSLLKDDGTVTRYYIHTPGGSLLYSIEAGGNQRRFYHYDEMGSALILSDDAGVITDTYAYTAYGQLTASTGAGDNPFTYVGRLGVMREPATPLYYMRARYYDSSSGRFLSRDPRGIRLASPKSANLYQYAAQNPKRFIDALGAQEARPVVTDREGRRVRPIPSLEDFLRSVRNAMIRRMLQVTFGYTEASLRALGYADDDSSEGVLDEIDPVESKESILDEIEPCLVPACFERSGSGVLNISFAAPPDHRLTAGPILGPTVGSDALPRTQKEGKPGSAMNSVWNMPGIAEAALYSEEDLLAFLLFASRQPGPYQILYLYLLIWELEVLSGEL